MMKIKKFIALIAWFLIAIVVFYSLTTTSFAQTTESACDYDCLADKIKSRVNLMVQYQTAKDYYKMFDLMQFDEKVARDDFINTEKSLDETVRSRNEIEYCEFAGFRTDDISILEPDRKFAIISGCIKCKKGAKTIFFQGQTEAIFTNDNWFFNSPIVGNSGNGIVSCARSM